jgi:hypothetical protein
MTGGRKMTEDGAKLFLTIFPLKLFIKRLIS